MKKIGLYFLIGCVIAIGGMIFSAVWGQFFFNGMDDFGSACVLGMGMYLCVVVVTCTGIIITKIESKSRKDHSNEDERG